MTKDVAGNDRVISVGPFKYNEGKAPDVTNFVTPTVTDSFGNTEFEKQWNTSDPFDAFATESRPHGVTGMYLPDQKRCLVDNRAYIHHPAHIEQLEGRGIPDISTNFQSETKGFPPATQITAIPFSAGYMDNENLPPSAATIPDLSSYLFTYLGLEDMDPKIESIDSAKDVTVDDIYSMIYALRLTGIPENAAVEVEHNFRRRFKAERFVKMSQLYDKLRQTGQLPEPKVMQDGDMS